MVWTAERSGVAVLPDTARASVALPNGSSEIRQLAIAPADADTGWLRVTASGICGTDVGLYAAGVAEPTILGHHVVGEIASIGASAARRWGVRAGDRVVIEEYLPCGTCPTCRTGPYRLCPATDIWGGGRRIGTIPVAESPGLLGGNADHVFLPPNAVVHRLPEDLDEELAAWVLPYANALDWTGGAGRLRPGDTVVVLGPGYHGLALVAAAVASGAGQVVVGGLDRDAERLEMAEALGGTPVVVGADDLTARVRAATGGRDADLVVDAVGRGRPGGRAAGPRRQAGAHLTEAARRGRCRHRAHGPAQPHRERRARPCPGGDRRRDLLPGRRQLAPGPGADRRRGPRRRRRHAHPARGRHRTGVAPRRRPALGLTASLPTTSRRISRSEPC
jgi:threonine dehydrogenase-like Zn-dependent dehydrogenase